MKEVKIVENKVGWDVGILQANLNLYWLPEGWELVQVTEKWLILQREASNQ